MNDIIEETMRAGIHGPAVTLYVAMCLLCMAERDGAERVDEVCRATITVLILIIVLDIRQCAA